MNGTVQSDPSQNLWQTPKGDKLLGRGPHTINKLIKAFDLILDPCCSGPDDCLIPEKLGGKFFTKKENGLTQDWKYNTIFNPPFSKTVIDNTTQLIKLKSHKVIGPQQIHYESALMDWTQKAVSQVLKHGITVIGIYPVYTSIAYFQQYIKNIAVLDFIDGRIHYTLPNGKTGSPNFDQMLVFWIPKK